MNGVCDDGINKGEISKNNYVEVEVDDLDDNVEAVGDPRIVRTKGASRKSKGRARRRYKCGKCEGYGLNSRNCVKKKHNSGSTLRGGRRRDRRDGAKTFHYNYNDVWDEVDGICGYGDASSGDTYGLSV